MDEKEVRQRMMQLGLIPILLADESYYKMAYAIDKGLDTQIKNNHNIFGRFFIAAQLLTPWTEIGKRFDALYRSDGDCLYENGSPFFSEIIVNAENIPCNYEQLIENLLPEWTRKNNSKDIYSVFWDQEHPNLELFVRLQESGNCYLHAPILLHWYLSLWNDPTINASDVDLIHLSKFVRNTYTLKDLYDYVVKDSGGDSLRIAKDIMRNIAVNAYEALLDTSFDKFVSLLKERGPALVEVRQLSTSGPQSFQEEGKYIYAGPRGDCKKMAGHAMLLIGVRRVWKDEVGKTQPEVRFLLQNFWDNKPLVEVSAAYLEESCTEIFFMNVGTPNCSETIYSQQTKAIRCAVTSKYLERAYQPPRFRHDDN